MPAIRQINIVPPAHPPRPNKFPLPVMPGLSLPAATIHTSLRWQRLLSSPPQVQPAGRQLRLEATAPAGSPVQMTEICGG